MNFQHVIWCLFQEKLKVRLKTLEEGLNEIHVNTDMCLNHFIDESEATEIENIVDLDEEDFQSKKPNDSGFLYDRLQKEVIKPRKSCEAKDSSMQDKDEEVKVIVTFVFLFHTISSIGHFQTIACLVSDTYQCLKPILLPIQPFSHIQLKIQYTSLSDAREES